MIGILLIIIGLTIRVVAIRTLKKNFTLYLGIPTNIQTTGIYKYIRHPSYLGSLIYILGLCLVSPVLGIMQLALAFFLARIQEEEKFLNTFIVYGDYKNRTGMLLPKIKELRWLKTQKKKKKN